MTLPVAFFALFFAYPVSAIVARGLKDGGQWQFARVGEVLGDERIGHVLWFTTWQALASTALTLALALPGAYVFARFDFPGKQLLRAVVTVPFVLPTVVVGSAFLALLGRGGLLDELWGMRLDTTVWAILLAHVFFNYAVVVRTVGGLWAQLDPRQEEAARVLGAGRFAAWRRVTLPALAPSVAAAALMVFLFTFTSFGVVQILGGPRYATLEVEIYQQTARLLDLPTAAVLTLVQFVAVAVLLAVHAWTVRRRESALKLVDAAHTSRRPRGAAQWALLASVLTVVALLILVPLVVLVLRSFDGPDGYGLAFYRALASADDNGGTFVVAPLEAIGNSLACALAATGIAVVVGGLAAAALTRRAGRLVRGFDALLMLPLGTSAVTVGFGFLITLDEPPLDLRSSWILVPLAQALVGVPFVVRIMLPVLRAVDARLREAAAVLGASPLRAWREVDLPLVGRALAVAAGFAFAVSLGEFGATVFIARPDNPTLPVAVARLLGRPGELNYGQAMALSTILMLVCAAALLVLERVRTDRSGEF
ncbi:Sulfate transport system permease protein CysW [Streptomyces netropsis]|uniref:Thiamine transport system permease protein n=1 Tax=Streptomyces syringium TaxID=76729 RepID=A0ABS4Y9H2_9ACTN|nr:iron ABC transporter permease [Streptomyces syringium]MBP2405445.1 thiamine transport system permease protein [Streptomyces syringium]SPE58491.1 Sulfate transport system permease protein CysW [Streptomyces netropsis]